VRIEANLLIFLVLPYFVFGQTPQEQPAPQAQPEAQTPQTPQAEVKTRDWSNVTTLSYVAASGNSSVNTLGFSNDFIRKWNLTALTVKGGMIRYVSIILRHSC